MERVSFNEKFIQYKDLEPSCGKGPILLPAQFF
jgi:hypothetical protein